MSTDTVPGADPANRDKLTGGCWAEHEDGSMVFVKDITENDVVIFEIYDFKDRGDPVFWPHALALKDFENTFSYRPKKKKHKDIADIKWIWHDKTPMPWDRIMKVIKSPSPQSTNVEQTLSAANRLANSLNARLGAALNRDHLLANQGFEEKPSQNTGLRIRDRLYNAMRALVE